MSSGIRLVEQIILRRIIIGIFRKSLTILQNLLRPLLVFAKIKCPVLCKRKGKKRFKTIYYSGIKNLPSQVQPFTHGLKKQSFLKRIRICGFFPVNLIII